MGRKIPGKKHHCVKDPEKQRQTREKNLKNKINAPPKNPCEQEISRTLKKLIDYKKRLQEKYKTPKQACVQTCVQEAKRETKKCKSPKLTDSMKKCLKRLGKPDKPAVSFVQLSGESNRSFLTRVNQTCQEFINEVRFENKYGVRVKQNLKTGDVECEKVPKEEYCNTKRVCKKQSKKFPEACDDPLSKKKKRKLKLNEKAKKKELKRIDEFSGYKDHVTFGETVNCPPTLTKPKKKHTPVTSKAGSRNLLLTELFRKSAPNLNELDTQVRSPYYIKASASETKVTVNIKGKRKNLPYAIRQKMEKQQSCAIEAYRSMKSRR